MTLTLELDLDIFSLDLHAKMQACMSVHLARIVRQMDTHTHTQKDRQTTPKLLHPPLMLGLKTYPFLNLSDLHILPNSDVQSCFRCHLKEVGNRKIVFVFIA